jgi:hypothetical protein
LSTDPTPAPESLKQKLRALIVRIPVTEETLTAAMLLTQQIIALAIVLKVPLQVEKVVPVKIEASAAPSVEDVAAALNNSIETMEATKK